MKVRSGNVCKTWKPGLSKLGTFCDLKVSGFDDNVLNGFKIVKKSQAGTPTPIPEDYWDVYNGWLKSNNIKPSAVTPGI